MDGISAPSVAFRLCGATVSMCTQQCTSSTSSSSSSSTPTSAPSAPETKNTIHTKYLMMQCTADKPFKLLKEECPHAFGDKTPVCPDTVFIDGQVKLMKAAQVDTWSVFFAVQFFKTIENGFALGASTVVHVQDQSDMPGARCHHTLV
jgi:hypothetical protein